MDSKVLTTLDNVTLNDIPMDTIVSKQTNSTIWGCLIEEQLYALKGVDLDSVAGANLLNEKKALTICNSIEGIPPLIKSFKDDKRLYLLKRFVSGCTVEKLFIEYGKIETPLAIFITKQVLSIIAQIHSKGLAFRDLKANNVVLTKQGSVCIIDMGFCTEVDTENKSISCGAYHAMAPELFRDDANDGFGVDIWSVGILLWEMLTGSPPWSLHGTFDFFSEKNNSEELPKTPSNDPVVVSLLKDLLVFDPLNRPTAEHILNSSYWSDIPISRTTAFIDPYVEEIEMQSLGLDETVTPPTAM